jgi:hypothetical protein
MVAAARPPERPSMTPVPDDQPSEPNAAVTEVADETEMPLPRKEGAASLQGLTRFPEPWTVEDHKDRFQVYDAS